MTTSSTTGTGNLSVARLDQGLLGELPRHPPVPVPELLPQYRAVPAVHSVEVARRTEEPLCEGELGDGVFPDHVDGVDHELAGRNRARELRFFEDLEQLEGLLGKDEEELGPDRPHPLRRIAARAENRVVQLHDGAFVPAVDRDPEPPIEPLRLGLEFPLPAVDEYVDGSPVRDVHFDDEAAEASRPSGGPLR